MIYSVFVDGGYSFTRVMLIRLGTIGGYVPCWGSLQDSNVLRRIFPRDLLETFWNGRELLRLQKGLSLNGSVNMWDLWKQSSGKGGGAFLTYHRLPHFLFGQGLNWCWLFQGLRSSWSFCLQESYSDQKGEEHKHVHWKELSCVYKARKTPLCKKKCTQLTEH